MIKQIRIVAIILTLIDLLIIIFGIFNELSYAKYQKANGIIISVENEYGTSIETTDTLSHYIVCKYSVEGHEYIAKKQVFFKFNNKVGKKICLRYNPDNPEEIENTYKSNCLRGIGIFVSLVVGVLWLSLIKKH